MPPPDFDVIVLAGDRGPDDPVARHAGVVGKTLAPIGGRPMACHVLDRVVALEGVGRVVMVCPDRPAYLELAAAAGRVDCVAAAASPVASVSRALEWLGGSWPVVVVTADHPLIRAAWIERLLAAARDHEADLAVGVTRWEQVVARFPEGRRTRYRFADGGICGTNLFVLRTPASMRAVEAWREVESDRKRPWRIVRRLGPVNLLKYAAGRLALESAFGVLSQRVGARLVPVVISDPESAVDVDSPADLELVRGILLDDDPDK